MSLQHNGFKVLKMAYDLINNRFVQQTRSEIFVARYIERVHKKIQDKRQTEMMSDLRYLKRYEYHESKRLRTFIQSYQEELEKGERWDYL